MGLTGTEIFCRRVQAVEGWGDALWLFADRRSLDALRKLGVDVKDADEMIETLIDWDKVGTIGSDRVEGMETKQQVRVEYVLLLERVVGVALEGKVEEVKKAAAGT
jgi:hypothetical protein